MATVRYFVPEDGDLEDQPNVFLAPKTRGITLHDIKSSFPLPGKYFFRFKSPLIPGGDSYDERGEGVAVWMDCAEDSKPVPLWRSSIIAKVTRLSMEDDDDDDFDDDDDKEFEELRRNGNKSYMNGGSVHHTSAATSSSYHHPINASISASSVSSNPVSPRGSPPPPSDDLLNVFDDQKSASSSAPPSTHASSTNLLDETAHESLLDFGESTNATPSASNNSSAGDLLGMTMDLPPANVSHSLPPQPVPPLNPIPNISAIPSRTQHQTQHQTQKQQPKRNPTYSNTFAQNGPFGDLNWN